MRGHLIDLCNYKVSINVCFSSPLFVVVVVVAVIVVVVGNMDLRQQLSPEEK